MVFWLEKKTAGLPLYCAHLVVCSQVVNLLLKNTGPKIFADELHDIKLIFETWCVFGKPANRKEENNTFSFSELNSGYCSDNLH